VVKGDRLKICSSSGSRFDSLSAASWFLKPIERVRIVLLNRGITLDSLRNYINCYKIFIKFTNNQPITTELIEEYILKSKQKRTNVSLMRIIYPELTKDLKFPKRTFKLKILPSDQELQTFYNGLDEREKIIFTLLRESGLRIGELLGAQLDPVNQMLIPKEHSGQTKHSYISFYRTPVNEIPKISKKRIEYLFFENSRKTGIKVNPHLLRSVFARDMSKRGVPSHYIDAYCGGFHRVFFQGLIQILVLMSLRRFMINIQRMCILILRL